MNTDARKYTRFLAQDDAFAALENVAVGKVKDISMGGLAIEYINIYEYSNLGSSHFNIYEPSHLSLFLSKNNFHLPDIKCKIIYDINSPIPAEQQQFITSITPRLCGVKFGMLSEDIRAQLDFFIDNHTKELS